MNYKTKIKIHTAAIIVIMFMVWLALLGLYLHSGNVKAAEREKIPATTKPRLNEIVSDNVNQRTTLVEHKPDYTYIKATTPLVETVEKHDEWESLGEYTLTAYCPCVKCCGIWSAEHPKRKGTDYVQKTASGTIPEAGRTVGANTGILPFGTIIRINGHEYTVEDTGGAAKRNKYIIDVFCETHDDAIEFGRQKIEVWVKK